MSAKQENDIEAAVRCSWEHLRAAADALPGAFSAEAIRKIEARIRLGNAFTALANIMVNERNGETRR